MTPVGRVLPSGDGDEAGDRLADSVFSRELARRIAFSLEQGAQTGIYPFDVFVPKRLSEDRVDAVKQVVDVTTTRSGMCEIEIPVRVGGADDPVILPGNDEEHALFSSQDQPGIAVDSVARDDEMDAFRRAHVNSSAAGTLLDMVCPDAGGVHHLPRFDREILSRLETPRIDASDPRAGHLEIDRANTRECDRAVDASGAHEGQGVSRIIHPRIEILNPPDHLISPKAGKASQHAAPSEMAMSRQRTSASEYVVEKRSSPDIETFPKPVNKGVEEGHGTNQVGA